VAVGGKSIVEHNEILGMDAALRFLNASLVHRIGEIDMQVCIPRHFVYKKNHGDHNRYGTKERKYRLPNWRPAKILLTT
jgi:hypothetical protein